MDPETTIAHPLTALCEPFPALEAMDLDPLLQRIGAARIVLLGGASYGTSEFYRMRARITQALIERKRFDFIAIDGDWPDAARVDHYVQHRSYPPSEWSAFSRFPTWMWRNGEVRDFVEWLRRHNAEVRPGERVAFHGLDRYSLYSSIRAVLEHLDVLDREAAQLARERYACLVPWQPDRAPVRGRSAVTRGYESCEREILATLTELLARRVLYAEHDSERSLDAVQHARLSAEAERYYRLMYYGERAVLAKRDAHMFETLEELLSFREAGGRAIVWTHNAQAGDSAATEAASRGESNLGHLCRQKYGDACFALGFGTDHGTVAAASSWDGAVEPKIIEPAIEGSYERLFHGTGVPRFSLVLRGRASRLDAALGETRLERAIGAVYRGDSEPAGRYFEASLARQFDELIWFDETRSVVPLAPAVIAAFPDRFPFAL